MSSDTEKHKVLVIEDDDEFLILLDRVLTRSGYIVETVNNPDDFLRLLKQKNFSFIIMDYILFGFNAADLVMRMNEEGITTPFLIISGFANVDMTIDMMKIGAKDVLLKDHTLLEVLPRKLEKYLSTEKEHEKTDSFQQMLSVIYNKSPLGLILIDDDYNVRLWNDSATQIFGWSYDELIGRKLPLKLAGSNQKGLFDYLSEVVNEQNQIQTEKDIYNKNSDLLTVHLSLTSVDITPSNKGVLLIAENTTLEKKSRQDLKRSEEKYRILAENISDLIWITDRDLNFDYISPSALKMTGYSADEISSRGLNDFVDEKHLKKIKKCYQQIIDNLPENIALEYEFEFMKKDQSIIWVEGQCQPFLDSKGDFKGFLSVNREITKRKEVQKQKEEIQSHLRVLQRRETIGILAGGIAHDFNNLLTIIQGSIDIFSRKNKEIVADDNIYINQVNESVEKASNLTRQLLVFGKRMPLKPAPLNVNTIIKNLEKMLTRVISENIEISFIYNEFEDYIIADYGHLEQVIMNLVINASEAIDKGGLIIIETGIENIEPGSELAVRGLPGRYVYLKVTDNGCGINESDLDSIFDPFFTTKEKEGASGLGLSIVQDIVKKYQGFIRAARENNETVISVFLPLSNETDTYESITEKKTDDSASDYNEDYILVIEDDESLMQTISHILKDTGWPFEIAMTIQEAEKIFTENPEKFSILFSDIVLPDGSGLEFAKKIRQTKKNIKVLLSSGYPQHRADWIDIENSEFKFLKKPYRLMELVRTIRNL